jgi:uncharacterized membrane protein
MNFFTHVNVGFIFTIVIGLFLPSLCAHFVLRNKNDVELKMRWTEEIMESIATFVCYALSITSLFFYTHLWGSLVKSPFCFWEIIIALSFFLTGFFLAVIKVAFFKRRAQKILWKSSYIDSGILT